MERGEGWKSMDAGFGTRAGRRRRATACSGGGRGELPEGRWFGCGGGAPLSSPREATERDEQSDAFDINNWFSQCMYRILIFSHCFMI